MLKKDSFKGAGSMRTLLTLKFILLFLLVSIGASGANPGYSQDIRISLRMNDKPVKEVFSAIENQTGLAFFYSENVIDVNKKVSVTAENEPVEEVLDEIFALTGNSYVISGEQVYVSVRAKEPAVSRPVPSARPQQDIPVSGSVLDTNGEPIIGAYVGVKGSTAGGAITDGNGKFSLRVPAGATLEVSYIGHTHQEIEVGTQREFTITLLQDIVMMDQVVVVAFGEQKRSSFTGSASVISSDAIALRPVTSVMAAVEGSAPGVQIQSSSGAPDAGVSMRIRGASSINAGSSPLIIVDGAPYTGSMNNINPNDVESITLLKDAASTALYGARGGNGVVLVTTKKASRTDKVGVTFDARVAVSQVRKSDLYDVITEPGEFYEKHYLALYNYFRNGSGMGQYEANRTANQSWMTNSDVGGIGYLIYTVPDGEQLIGYNGKLNPNATLGRTVTGPDGKKFLLRPDNWVDESYRTGLRQDYNVSMRGGAEKFNILASLGFTDDRGISAPASYKRYTGRLNTTIQPIEWLTFRGSLDMAKSTSNHAYDMSSNSNNIFSNVNEIAPIYPIFIRDENGDIAYDDNGMVYDYGDGTYNDGVSRPIRQGSSRLQEALLQTNRTESSNIGARAAVDVKFIPELSATLNVTYGNRERRNNRSWQPFYGSSYPGGQVRVISEKNESVNVQQLINFNKSFGSHNLKATLLHEYDTATDYSLSGTKSNMFSYYENQELAGAINIVDTGSWSDGYQGEGFGGRVLYDYRGVYHFDASYRRDGSTKFDKDYRWGNFFSFGGAWLLSNEDFFDVGWVDQLKLKVSYGQNGNDQIGDYLFTDTYDIAESVGELALPFRGRGVPDITWETRSAVNAGIETELFGGRLSAGLEYYNNKTTNMLAAVYVPGSLGYTYQWENVGSMRNSGFEFDVTGHIVRNKDFRFSLSINGSLNRAKVLKLAEGRTGQTLYDADGGEVAVGYSSGSYFYGEGLEYRTWYLKRFAGTNDAGQPMWYVMDEETKEISTTTTYSSGSYFASGSSQPKLLGGFGGNFGWKALELSFRFAYRLGGYGYDSGYAGLMTPPYGGHTGYNFHKDIAGAWTPEKPSNTIPRWQYEDRNFGSASDRWLTRADYLNLQNITLSYTLPQKFTSRMGMQGLTVSAGVDDMFFWSKRKGFIPNRDFDGDLGIGYYPNTRRFMLSLKIDF